MEKKGTNPIRSILFILIAIVLVKCSTSFSEFRKKSRNDPRVQERLKQEEEDLNNRLLDRHFEEDSRRKR